MNVIQAETLSKFHGFQVTLLVGGTNLNTDIRRLNSATGNDIVVATPGRLLQHLKDTPSALALIEGVCVFVLDEADRLLDMGFKP